MTYLLDTNVCIEVLRGQNPAVAARLQREPRHNVRICSVVRAELMAGARQSKKSAENLIKVAAFADTFASLPFDDAAADGYAIIRAHLASRGQIIGPLDMMIAAIAVAHDAMLVTHNVGEFSRIPWLRFEDWQT